MRASQTGQALLACARQLRKRRGWLTAACAAGVAGTLGAPSHAQEGAKPADSFINTMGVNTHLGWSGTPYTNYTAMKTALLNLGVRHIRDGVTSIAVDSTLTSQAQDLASSGIHLQGGFDGNWYPVPVGSTPLSSSDVIAKVTALMPAIEIVEGPNETDLSGIFAYNNHGGFPGGTIAYDQDLYSIIKGSSLTSSLPVLVGSIGNSSRFPEMTAITPGPISYSDYGTIHSYPGGQTADTGIDWCLGYSVGLTGPKPMICGETGYHNNTQYLGGSIQPGVSEAAAGKYMPEVFLEMFNRGIVRCLSYELVDQHADAGLTDGNGESHFGLMHNDWTPKPAYTALSNMISVLKEPGANFIPGALNYSMTSVPSTVHHTLLQKSNGTYYLALWNNVSCYHTNSGSGGYDITNSPVQTTITLPSSQVFTVYSPSDSSGTAQTNAYTLNTTSTSITLSVPDRVIIVAISSAPVSAPMAPTGLTATPANGQVTLAWTASTGAASYNVYRGTAAGGESGTPIATGLTGTTAYVNTGLTNGSAYYYKVAAVNSAGTSTFSNEANATPSTASAVTPTGVTATAGNAQITLSWTPATGATSYNVYRSTTAGGEGTTAIATGITLPTYVNTGLTNGTTYYYKIASVNSSGTSAQSAETSAKPNTAPSAPTNLTAAPGNAQVALSWTAASGAASYNVYRGTLPGNEGLTPFATGITGTTFTDTGLTNGSSYYYTVAAVNSAFTSAVSNEAGGTPSASSQPDLVVTAITMSPASPVAGSHVVFTATVKNQGAGATPAGTVTGVSFAIDTPNGVVSWADSYTTSIPAGTSVQLTATGGVAGNYWNATSGSHTVTAWVDDVNRIGEGNESNNTLTSYFTIGSSGAPSAPTGLTATAGNAQVALSWNVVSGATSYNIYRGTTAGGESATAIATGVTTASFTNTGLTNGTAYYYKVAAVNGSGTSGQSNEASATPVAAPAAPSGLTATAGNTQVSLSWTASSGATSYNLYRGTTAGGESATAIATGITGTSYSNTGLTNGTQYFYKVKAVNSTGTSGYSNEASATPAAASSLQLQFKCISTVSTAVFLQHGFNIVNNGSTSIPYSQLKIRYWYTEDGTAAQTFQCLTAPMGTTNVTGAFVTMGTPTSTADHYVEISFTGAAGSLAGSSSSGEIDMNVNKNDFSVYTQSNDWSWNSAYTSLTNWSNVTLYQNGTLVWGTEPS